ESGYRATFAFRDARETKRPVVLAGRRPIGREVIDTYLGAAPILDADSTVIGAVVVTVPYFFESLAFATRPESRRPLLLGLGGAAHAPGLASGGADGAAGVASAAAAGGDAPAGVQPASLEGRLVVSRFERGALTASSDPTIPPGLALPKALA